MVLPEDVSLAAAPLKSDFLRLTPCQFSLCKRVALAPGITSASVRPVYCISSGFRLVFTVCFALHFPPPVSSGAPHAHAPEPRRASPTTFLQRLPLEDAVLAASDTFRRVPSPLYLSTASPSSSSFLPPPASSPPSGASTLIHRIRLLCPVELHPLSYSPDNRINPRQKEIHKRAKVSRVRGAHTGSRGKKLRRNSIRRASRIRSRGAFTY